MAPRVIDADMHFYEPRNLWIERIDRRFRDRALRIEEDERGFPWLVSGSKKIQLAEVHVPGRVELLGEGRRREREWDGRKPPPFEEQLRPEYYEVGARLRYMDEHGVDAGIFFPNFGLAWEDLLRDDVPATCANMEAYNTWAAEVSAEAPERLYGVAHLTLRDPQWAEREIARIARAGLRLAMIGPNPVDGKALAHPDLDRIWACFQDHEVAPVFHVSRPSPFPGVPRMLRARLRKGRHRTRPRVERQSRPAPYVTKASTVPARTEATIPALSNHEGEGRVDQRRRTSSPRHLAGSKPGTAAAATRETRMDPIS
ncbi:MAG: hypothetical protein KatS3mg076_0936 [Candidatus Binatia bacterium]|nr:MAG: hypothetical protein KatS3mg076_0936 [Candidatus Binatia bacterium]